MGPRRVGPSSSSWALQPSSQFSRKPPLASGLALAATSSLLKCGTAPEPARTHGSSRGYSPNLTYPLLVTSVSPGLPDFRLSITVPPTSTTSSRRRLRLERSIDVLARIDHHEPEHAVRGGEGSLGRTVDREVHLDRGPDGAVRLRALSLGLRGVALSSLGAGMLVLLLLDLTRLAAAGAPLTIGGKLWEVTPKGLAGSA